MEAPRTSKSTLALILLLACLMPTAVAWAYFVGLAEPGSSQPNRLAQVTYAAGKVVQFSLPLLFVGIYERRRDVLAQIWDSASRPAGVLPGLGFGLVVAAFILTVYHLRMNAVLNELGMPARLQDKVTQLDAASPAKFLLLAAFLSILHSFLEEYYWRWFVFGRLRELVPMWLATLLSGLAFMSHHVIVLDVYLPGAFWRATLPFSLCIAVGGFFWAWLFHRSNSLLGPWLGHLLIDTVIMGVGYQMLFGES